MKDFRKRFKRASANSGFIEFLGLFWQHFDSFCGDHMRKWMLSPQKESKLGSKEPKNRQELNPQTLSNRVWTRSDKVSITKHCRLFSIALSLLSYTIPLHAFDPEMSDALLA